jgi:hypothetical protein
MFTAGCKGPENYLHATEQFLTNLQFLSQSRMSLSFMEPEDSLRLQEPTIGPYPEPDEPSPHFHDISSTKNLILSSHLFPGLLISPSL